MDVTPLSRRWMKNAQKRSKFLELFDISMATGKRAEFVDADGIFDGWYFSDPRRSYNLIASGFECPNECMYCYIGDINTRFNRKTVVPDIEEVPVPEKKITKGWATVTGDKRKLYMFPSSHDIFPGMEEPFLEVALKMIAAGHELTITTKPRRECMEKILEGLRGKEKSVMFMITICTLDDNLARLWEKKSPLVSERLECMKMIRMAGFNVSVSIEPYLSDPIVTVHELEKTGLVNGWYYIGPMSGKYSENVAYKKEYYDIIIRGLRDNPRVHFKDGFLDTYVKIKKSKK